MNPQRFFDDGVEIGEAILGRMPWDGLRELCSVQLGLRSRHNIWCSQYIVDDGTNGDGSGVGSHEKVGHYMAKEGRVGQLIRVVALIFVEV